MLSTPPATALVHLPASRLRGQAQDFYWFSVGMAPQVRILALFLLSLCCDRGSLRHSASWKPQWPLLRVPVVMPQQTLERPAPHFLAEAKLEVTSTCDPDCHKQAPTPGYWDLREYLSYETLHANGSLVETAVGIYGFNTADLRREAAGRSRARRQIYGPDSRFSIVGQDFLLNYPFSTAVKLSTGCTGTLVGDRHVLTAAHCVHDGKNYVKGAQKLRVGFLKPRQRDAPQANRTGSPAGPTR
ncbi:hypothetical protein ANANG_G00275320 [Anguilla anguilla]|uniref:Serine protease 23 n=1 Tax=Anguilla anguilla TaxID=7936 RepID=A0A9D3LQM1_ANGAN|nr:hypothetical protein ANANG_G00275320 [Anguilla anguilla]